MTADVVIIGAGSAGLAAAAALQRHGIDPVVLEEVSGVATSWRRRHDRLRLNTTRRTSALGRLPIPRRAGRWVSRDEYIAYLERFAAHQRVRVRFNTTVHRIDRSDDGWQIATDARVHHASDVVVATGLQRVAWIPDWVGRSGYRRIVLHAADLSRVADLSGQHVLLVGAGNSGVDIAAHLIDAGVASLWLSVRTPPNIVPAEIHRVPLQSVALAARPLPERLRDGIARFASRYAFGDLDRFGLPTPVDGPYRHLRTTGVTVAVDQGFVAHLKAGRVRPVAEIHHLDGAEVVLVDGTRTALHRFPRRHRGQPPPTLHRSQACRRRHRSDASVSLRHASSRPNVGTALVKLSTGTRMCTPRRRVTLSVLIERTLDRRSDRERSARIGANGCDALPT